MTGQEILILLGKALISGVVSQVSKRGTAAVMEYLERETQQMGTVFTREDRELAKKLLSSESSFLDVLLAHLKLPKGKGIALVGPSGVGKSTLVSYLTEGKVTKPTSSTHERKSKNALFGARFIKVVDTPGSLWQVNTTEETFEYVEKGKISVLVMMMASGYLDTVGVSGFTRPGRKVYPGLTKYLESCQVEEMEWLDEFLKQTKNMKRKIPSCMVVINKMDHWIDEIPDVLEHYQANPMREFIDRAVAQVCRADVKPSFHIIACDYNSFKGKAPSGNMSLEGALISLAVLRAEIYLRLKENA